MLLALLGFLALLPASAKETVAETYVYKKAGKHSVHADVYRPSGKGPWPVVVWIHGGSFVMGGRQWLPSGMKRQLVSAGFLVVSVDYRLFPASQLSEIVDDAVDAVQWVQQKGPKLFRADKNEIALVGHSAGGYLALVAATRMKPRPKAVGLISGFGSLLTPFYMHPSENIRKNYPPVSAERVKKLSSGGVVSNAPNQQRYEIYVRSRQHSTWLKDFTGHDPVAEKEWYRPFEPLELLDDKFPPVIQVHSAEDEVLPITEAERVRDALAAAGIKHEYLVVPGKDHAFHAKTKDNQDVRAALTKLVFFLADALGR